MSNIKVWKDITGFEGLYQVNDLGLVKSLAYQGTQRDLILKLTMRKDGYQHVILSKNTNKKSFLVHRLTAIAFIPNPQNKPEINHKDFNKSNNCLNNLEWVSAKENMSHAVTGGHSPRGERHRSAKLTEAQVKRIRLMKEIDPKITHHEVADMFNISARQIGNILSRSRWRHI